MAAVAIRDHATAPPAPLVLFIRSRPASATWLMEFTLTKAWSQPGMVRGWTKMLLATRLEQIIRRGQRAGDFDRALPETWLAAAILGLFRAAAEEVAAGRLTDGKAAALLLDSALRLCGAVTA